MKTFLIALVAFLVGILGCQWYAAYTAPEMAEDVAQEYEVPAPSQKLNIDEVCNSALAYMTFPDGESAEVFIEECKNGEHPEVIERYKADMGLGDGAAI